MSEENKDVCPPGQELEEEDGLVDEQAKYRKQCKATKECSKFFDELTSCNDRVTSKTKTAETCLEEMIDFVHCVDHCASKKFFPKLK